MPAITVEDPQVLPAIEPPDASARPRPVLTVTTAPSAFEGEGFPVRRAFAGVPTSRLDPFLHMDQMGPVDYRPGEPKGTSWHPHRGFETVTYILDGAFQHEDSTGAGGLISDGDTQWMTAGAGVLHIETPPADLVRSGGHFHGIQLWVNLPAAKKWSRPRYQDITADRVTLLRSLDGRAILRVIAGDVAGHRGPGVTHTPIALVHATIRPGAELVLPWDPTFNALVYVLAGRGTVGADVTDIAAGQLAVLGEGDTIVVCGPANGDTDLDVLILGGDPIREPVVAHGPFVMNTREEIIQAFEDFQSGKMGTIPRGAIGT